MSKYDAQIDIAANDSHGMILRQIQSGSSVLEFGSAAGSMTRYMREELDCNVYIVEIDEEAFDQASQWAAGGICGSIEDYAWLDRFRDKRFDYILFADVLEHLSDPRNVLLQARALLKEEGEVIVSVPNMAYSGILAELCQNQFQYRETGLLDSSHIHFFAYQSLVDLFDEAGYSITVYDGTRCHLKDSEFKALVPRLTPDQRDFLKSKSLADVYQFIFTAVKKEYFEQSGGLKIQDILNVSEENHKVFIGSSWLSAVYFDCGTGFSEENCIRLEFEDGKPFHQKIRLPKNCKAIRFDPVEETACLIWDLRVRTESVFLSVNTHNGTQINDVYLFRSADPQMYIENIPVNSRWIYIDTEIVGMDQSAWIKMVQEVEALGQQCETLKTHQAELAQYKTCYLAAVDQCEALNRQLAEVQNAYNVISNATFWKMTKPLRIVLDFIKRPFRSNRYIRLFFKGLKCLKENGVRYTWQKVKYKLHHRREYLALAVHPLYTPEELEKQRNHAFPCAVKFSIVVPLYNTPKKFLHEMIQSVMDQTYGVWELCMADGSDREHAYVEQICRGYTEKDKRVVYRKLNDNKGISENTNACIDMSTGDYIGLLDHDDLLHPAALYDVMTAICEKDADFVYTDEASFQSPDVNHILTVHYKADFAPDTLRSYNYICHFTVFRRTLLEQLGEAFRPKFDGSQDYDLILRLTERAAHIIHIPKILYYWRSHKASVASDVSAKPYTIPTAKMALAEHLARIGLDGEVLDAKVPSLYQIRYKIIGKPLVSIMVPNKDHVDDLERCINSIREKSTYSNWEIIIIENNSTEQQTFDFYTGLQHDKRIQVVCWDGPFNFSAINNFGAKYAHGEHLLLLNNDTEIITPDWIEQMLMFGQRQDIGAVGAMLYYPDDTIQHAGVILGLGGVAGHSHKYFQRTQVGYMNRLIIAQNFTAVTGACLMVRRDVWEEVKGLDESFEVAFNDVDFCMRIRKAGYLIAWTPFAELYHYESRSRGYEDTPEKIKRFEGEVERFQKRWAKELAEGDPYYNPNFTLEREDFSLR